MKQFQKLKHALNLLKNSVTMRRSDKNYKNMYVVCSCRPLS